MTDPDQPEGTDLGQVLRCALAKRTHTFTAIVGYFGHGGSGSESLSDPAGLVAGELGDHADQDVDDSEERARFCLLYGALVTTSSSTLALGQDAAGSSRASVRWQARRPASARIRRSAS